MVLRLDRIVGAGKWRIEQQNSPPTSRRRPFVIRFLTNEFESGDESARRAVLNVIDDYFAGIDDLVFDKLPGDEALDRRTKCKGGRPIAECMAMPDSPDSELLNGRTPGRSCACSSRFPPGTQGSVFDTAAAMGAPVRVGEGTFAGSPVELHNLPRNELPPVAAKGDTRTVSKAALTSEAALEAFERAANGLRQKPEYRWLSSEQRLAYLLAEAFEGAVGAADKSSKKHGNTESERSQHYEK